MQGLRWSFIALLCACLDHSAGGIKGLAAAAATKEPVAAFPLQISAWITITAHMIEPESEYPPRERRIRIHYDYVGKRAKVNIEAGYEAAKFYIRRYDLDHEYMVRLPPIHDCKRSHLGEVMPYPEIPNAKFVREEVVNGTLCNYFLHQDFETRVHLYFRVSDNAPIKLIQESTEDDVSTPLLTYEFSDIALGDPLVTSNDPTLYDLPRPFEHGTCTNHVGGFPYMHIFHYFVRI